MKKTNRDVEKKEDGEGLGWGKEGEEERGAGGGDKKEEDCRSVQTSTGNLPIQTMNLVMTCRRRRAGVNKQFCSEGIPILREIYYIYFS